MKVTLLEITPNAANSIGNMAAICYDGGTDPDSNIKRAKHCKSKGHLMTMRFAYATFEVSEISRVTSHQLVRIAIAGILQESQRYVKQSNIQYVIPPVLQYMPWYLRALWRASLLLGSYIYDLAIRCGVKKEDARYILSQSCHTKVRLCLNFHAWQNVLHNRCAKSAQWEIREVALEIQRQLREQCPDLF